MLDVGSILGIGTIDANAGQVKKAPVTSMDFKDILGQAKSRTDQGEDVKKIKTPVNLSKQQTSESKSVESPKQKKNNDEKNKTVDQEREEKVAGKEKNSNRDKVYLLQEILSFLQMYNNEFSNGDMVKLQEALSVANINDELEKLLNEFQGLDELVALLSTMAKQDEVSILSKGQEIQRTIQELIHQLKVKIDTDLEKTQNFDPVLKELEKLMTALSKENQAGKVTVPTDHEIYDEPIPKSRNENQKSSTEVVEVVNKEGNKTLKEDTASLKIVDHQRNEKLLDKSQDIASLSLENSMVTMFSAEEQMVEIIKFENGQLDPKTFVQQLTNKMIINVSNGKSEIKIQLLPEHLGKMSIKIGVEEGVLTGKIFAETHGVKEIIETNLMQLRTALEEKGITVGNLEVHVGNESQEFNHNFYQSQWNGGSNKGTRKQQMPSLQTTATIESYDEKMTLGNPYLSLSQFDTLA